MEAGRSIIMGYYSKVAYVFKKEDEPKFRFSVNEAVAAADDFIHGKKIEDVMCAHNAAKYAE